MIVRLRLLTLVCAGLLATSATQVRAQSLEAALSQAYMSNPTLNAQRAAARAFDENVPQALGGYRPTLEGTADVSIDTTRSTAREGLPGMSRTSTTTLFPRGVGLQATQNLFNGFRTGNSVRAAESGVLGQRESLRNIEQNILLDAVTAYMNVLRDAAVLNLAQNNVEVLEEQLRQTQDRFDVGEVTRTDVEQAKASVAGARSEMLGAQAQLKSSTAIYRQVIGSEPRRLGPGRSIEKLIPKRLESAIAAGLKVHPSITAALHAVDVAALQVKVAEGALYPSLNATSSVSQRWDAGQALESTNFTVGAFLSVPIYEGGVDYSRIRQAKETLGQRRIEADVTREQVRAAVVSAWGVLEASIAQISATQAQVAAAEVALSGVREEAKVGQRTTLDVLNQQQALLNARVALVTAQRDRVVAAYSLLSAIGKLTAKTLRLKVTEYDPGIHYDQVRNKWIGTNTPDGR